MPQATVRVSVQSMCTVQSGPSLACSMRFMGDIHSSGQKRECPKVSLARRDDGRLMMGLLRSLQLY